MKVNEIFNSIDGEGKRTGMLVSFIRLTGCNLRCSYCDTTYALSPSNGKETTITSILQTLDTYQCPNVTITGGEPLIHEGIDQLVDALIDHGYNVNIETNGSVDITPYLNRNTLITMDYKLPSSDMESSMDADNLPLLRDTDVLKFVVSDVQDLNRMMEVISTNTIKAKIYISPVSNKMNPQTIVQFMKDNHLTSARLQLQLHKIIWNPDTKGV